MSQDSLSSPSTTTRKALAMPTVIPLDSVSRQTPIHPALPEIKLPNGDYKPYQYHPVTCELLASEDLVHHKLQQLQKQYPTSEAALQAQQEAIKEVKQRLRESEQKTREIDRDMEVKEKMREVERKVYQKQGKGVSTKT